MLELIGLGAITTKCFVLFSFTTYAVFTILSASLILQNSITQDVCIDMTPVVWLLITNVLAPTSAILFYRFEKGTTLSVVGALSYVANFCSMLVLFVYIQTREAPVCQSHFETSVLWLYVMA